MKVEALEQSDLAKDCTAGLLDNNFKCLFQPNACYNDSMILSALVSVCLSIYLTIYFYPNYLILSIVSICLFICMFTFLLGLDIHKNLLFRYVKEHWDRLSTEVACSLSLKFFIIHLENAMYDLIWRWQESHYKQMFQQGIS